MCRRCTRITSQRIRGYEPSKAIAGAKSEAVLFFETAAASFGGFRDAMGFATRLGPRPHEPEAVGREIKRARRIRLLESQTPLQCRGSRGPDKLQISVGQVEAEVETEEISSSACQQRAATTPRHATAREITREGNSSSTQSSR